MSKSFLEKIADYPRTTILLSLIVSIGMMAGLKNTSFNSDYQIFFSDNNPNLRDYKAFQEDFSKDDVAVILMEAKNGNILQKEHLSSIKRLTEASWGIPHATRVDSLSNHMDSRAEGDSLVIEELIDNPSRLGPEELKVLGEKVISDPQIVNIWISEDKSLSFVSVTLDIPSQDTDLLKSVVSHIRNLVDEEEKKNPNIKFSLTGNIIIGNGYAEAAEKDVKELIPLMYLVMSIVMIYFLRSLAAVALTFLVLFLSCFTAVGTHAWFNVPLNTVTVGVPNIIVTLAIADAIHYFTVYQEQLRKDLSPKEAALFSINKNFMAITITSITTAIGFMGMLFNDIPPFKEMGSMAAVGVMMAYFLTVFLIFPASTLLKKKKVKEHPVLAFNAEKLSEFVLRNTKIIWTVSLSTMVIAVATISFFTINDDYVKYFDEDSEIRKAAVVMDKKIGGANRIDFAVGSKDPDRTITSPEYLNELESFCQFLEGQETVVDTNCFSDVFKRLNQDLHYGKKERYKVPESQELAAQYLLLYEMSLPEGRDLQTRVSVDKTQTRVTANLRQTMTQDIIRIADDSMAWTKDTGLAAYPTGISYIFANIYRQNALSLLSGAIMSVFLITIALMITFSSFKYGLLSLIPNFYPIMVGYAIWYFVHPYINIGVAQVALMSIGVVVDDTVHFITKYLYNRRTLAMNSVDAIKQTYRDVGEALIVTTCIIAMGFSVLYFSEFGMNKDLGVILSMIVVIALVADLLFLPVVVKFFAQDRKSLAQGKED